jgi:hypothetical protein
VLRERETDAVAGGRERHEQHAPDHADGDGQHGEHLPGVLRRHRVEARHHVLVEQRDGGEDHHGHRRVHEVEEPDAVPGRGARVRQRRAAVDDPEPAERGEPVPDGAPGVPEAVREAEHEAGERAERQEGARHGAVGADALAPRRDDRGQQLERQHGARRQQRRQVRRALVRLADGPLDRAHAAAVRQGALLQQRPLRFLTVSIVALVMLGLHVVVPRCRRRRRHRRRSLATTSRRSSSPTGRSVLEHVLDQ